jgi:hypothetical protein
VLVHFLQERQSTRNYARRIGSPSMDFANPGVQAEFDRRPRAASTPRSASCATSSATRRSGTPGAESGDVARVYRNDRRDRIRTRTHWEGRRQTRALTPCSSTSGCMRIGRGSRPMNTDLLEQERQAAEAAARLPPRSSRSAWRRDRAQEGGRSVPAP